MASMTALRTGLATRLQTIANLNVYATVPGLVNLPAAIVEPDEPLISFDSTMGRGSDDFYFTVLVVVQEGTVVDAQSALDGYLAGSGASSIKAAIEADGSLGGIASFAVVRSAGGYGHYPINGIECPGVRFKVEVTAP